MTCGPHVCVIYDAQHIKTFLSANEGQHFSVLIMDHWHIIYRGLKYATSSQLFWFDVSPLTHMVLEALEYINKANVRK